MWDAIKRIKKYAVCGVLFTILLLCGACGGGAIPEEKKVTVNFIDNVLCVFSQKTVTTDVGRYYRCTAFSGRNGFFGVQLSELFGKKDIGEY